jgi:hypothetical protein
LIAYNLVVVLYQCLCFEIAVFNEWAFTEEVASHSIHSIVIEKLERILHVAK